MPKDQLYALVEEALVQELARRVIEELHRRRNLMLVVYTGTNMGVDDTLDVLGRFQRNGFRYHVLFSRNAASVLNIEKIQDALRPEIYWIDTISEGIETTILQYETILVPALTVNSAARIAACQTDTAASAAVLYGLMRGKKVIAAIDGCCPDLAQRAANGVRMPAPLYRKLKGNLETLLSFGIKLTVAKELETALAETLQGTMLSRSVLGETQASCIPTPKFLPDSAKPSGLFEGKVLSASNITTCPEGSILRIRPGVLVTQLARDAARKRSVKIEIEK